MKRMLNEVEGLKRIRLSSIEMTEITDELIELIANDDRVARHLHIPLQVGNDRLLKLNNRPYTTEDYYNRISYIRSRIENVSISSDVIAGLPTETDEEFDQTAQFIKKCNLSFLHAFPYACKQHTVDATLKPQTPEIKKKERTAVLTELSKNLLSQFCDKFIGKTVDVVFETEEDGIINGHSSEYVVVKAKGDVNQCHTMQKVLITKKNGTELYGEIV